MSAFAPKPARSWVANPNWALSPVGELLLLSGGDDESNWLDEAADAGAAQRIHAAWQAGQTAALLDDPACAPALRQLQRIGALVPAAAAAPVARYALRWLGAPQPELARALAAALSAQPQPPQLAPEAQADLVLLLRSTAPWGRALANCQAAPPAQPHLLVDLNHHHTLVLGPLVVPGDTACVACLGMRLAHRWGEPPQPAQPAALHAGPLDAALLAQALHAVLGPATRLGWVEHSLALDLHTLAGRREAVYRLLGCPVCAPPPGDGRLADLV